VVADYQAKISSGEFPADIPKIRRKVAKQMGG
jgi:hypothetical protein